MGSDRPLTSWRGWWRDLGTAPEPLAPREWIACWVVAVLVLITRWLALSRTPWDWDEMLFMLAMRGYDVAAHHPHPPGFPLFIAFAKLLRPLAGSDFHALQSVTFAGAAAVFPSTFLLARELRLGRFATPFSAALLLSMFPNVLFFGGTAFSDVPSMTLAVLACALLLRGCRDARAFVAGALLLAIATGFRPQNLLLGCAPALMATAWQWRRSATRVVATILASAVIVAVSYGVAIEITGWERYRAAANAHRQYIAATDSFLSPARRSLPRLFDEFFIRPYRQGVLNAIVALLVAISAAGALMRRRGAPLMVLLIFGPFCVFAWLMLDVNSASRFSLGYIPLFALLAADGLRVTARRFALPAATVLALAMFAWSWPGLREAHRSVAPPVAAIDWIRAHADPRTTTLYVQREVAPYAEALAPQFARVIVNHRGVPVPWTEQAAAYFIGEGAGERTFARERGRLWDIARRRYFTASVTPLRNRVTFGDGWYEQEGRASQATRWMAGRAILQLPALGGRGRFAFSLFVPAELRGTTITLRVDGRVAVTLRGSEAYVDRTLLVDGTKPVTVTIETERTSAGSGRTLGLRLEWLEWSRQ